MESFEITEGTDVFGSDGDKVGSVVAVQPNHIVVEKGFFFPTDYYIPTSAITSAEGDKVYLNVSKDQALNQGWDTEPTGDYAATDTTYRDEVTTGTGATYADAGTTGTVGGYIDNTGGEVVQTDAGYVEGVDTATQRTDVSYDTAAARTNVTDQGTMRVPIHEEELTATTREREIGEVRIDTKVVSEEKTLDVPVTEERVHVQRHVVDRDVDASDEVRFEGDTITIPIRGEVAEVGKRSRVTEEIEVTKEPVQRTEQVGGTVRREEIQVSEDMVDQGESYRDQTSATERDEKRKRNS